MPPSRIIRGLFAASILSLSASAASIKLKSGTVQEGRIRGQIVLKGGERETTSEADPSKTVYGASYTVINGADITAIDDKGIHASKAMSSFDVSQEGDKLDDLDVVRTGLKIQGASPYGTTKLAGTVTRVDRTLSNPSSDSVLGEYRDAKPELLPAIEIETASGVVTVPIADIVQIAN